MTEERRPGWIGRLEWALAGLAGAIALGLHLVRCFHAGGLWRDEAAAVALARLPTFTEVWHSFQHEAFPLLVPALLRAFTALAGDGDGALRVLGLAVGLGVLAAFAASSWLTARTPPLAGWALLGINAPLLVFGDSLRGYGLGTLAAVLAFAFLARMLAEPRPLWIGAAALAALAAVQCLFPNAALVLSACAAAAVVTARRGRRRAIVAAAAIGAVAALSLLPYAAPLAAARSWNVVVTYPTSLRQILAVLIATVGPPPGAALWGALLLAAVGSGIALSVAGRQRRPETAESPPPAAPPAGAAPADLVLFGLLTLGLAGAGFAAFLLRLSYTPRAWYFLPLLGVAAAALDMVLAQAPRAAAARAGSAGGAATPSAGPRRRNGLRWLDWLRWLQLLRPAVAVAALLALVPPALDKAVMRQTNVDLVARRVAELAAGGDLVVVVPWADGVSFRRYYRGAAAWTTLPALADLRIHRYDLLKAKLASAQPIDDVLAAAGAALRSGHRVFLAGTIRFPAPGEPVPHLPPAPASAWGWHDIAYTEVWSRQLGDFVARHARRLAPVPLPPAGPVSRFEDLALTVADGWSG
ncbi:MAG TPA: hypothetical protein VHR45_10505 [Thermoanaerobaculia bacterium]|nr:hypothetical protein [Thermoanaerobaculia bacterium]